MKSPFQNIFPVNLPCLLKSLTAVLCLFPILAFLSCAPKKSIPNKTAPVKNATIKTPKVKNPPRKMTKRAKAIFYFLKYQALLNQHEQKQAVEALKKAIQLDPQPELYLEQAMYYLQRQDLEKGRNILKTALKHFPEHRELNFTLSKVLIKMKELNEALKLLKGFYQKHPQDHEAALKLGKIYLKENQPAKSLDLLKKIPEDEKDAQVDYLLGQAYSKLDNLHHAITHLKVAVQKKPDFLEAWAELAFQYELAKDYIKAEKAYQELFDRGADNSEILIRLIDLNLKMNQPEQALDLALKRQARTRLQIQAIGLFINQEFYSQAEELLSNLEEDALDKNQVMFYQAILAYKQKGDLDQALKILSNISSSSVYFPRALSLQCRLYYEDRDFQSALEAASKGQILFPEKEEFWLLENEILTSENKYKQAVQVLEESLNHLKGNTSLLFQLGVLYHELDQKDQAIEQMEKIIQINPEHAGALNFVGYTLAEQGKDYKRAEVLIKKALQMDPDNGYYLDSLAWLFYKKGNLKQAWKKIQGAISLIKNDPIIWAHYGDIALAFGLRQQALKGYKNALEHKHENPEEIEQKIKNMQDE